MKKLAILAAGLAMWGFATSASAQIFTNQASFMANVAPGAYTEPFNGWSYGSPLNGSQTTWAAPGNGNFNFTATAPQGLWSNPGALSTNNANDPLTFTFSNSPTPVTAFGGEWAGTDINGNPIASTVTFNTAGGSHTAQMSNFGFIGFISTTGPIVSVVVDTDAGATPSWPAGDNIITGALVPEPGTALVAGLGAMGLLLRRRK